MVFACKERGICPFHLGSSSPPCPPMVDDGGVMLMLLGGKGRVEAQYRCSAKQFLFGSFFTYQPNSTFIKLLIWKFGGFQSC